MQPRRETSVSNTFVTISLPVNDAPDLEQFLINSRDAISGIISRELVQRKALKYYLTVRVELERLSIGAERETATPYLHSIPAIILESTDFNETFQVASDRLSSLLATFQEQGSGFSLQRLIECHVNIATLDPVRGSSYIPLSAYIQPKKCCVNVKNADHLCILYALSYFRNPPKSHLNKPCSYAEDIKKFNTSGLTFPLTITQIPRFEKQNEDFSICVYALDESRDKSRENKVNLYPVYVSKDRKRRYQANLLLVQSPAKSHFVAITNMSRLLKGRVANNRKSFVCRYCLYCFSNESLLERHEGDCSEYPPLKITYPLSDDNILKFKNFGHTLEVPFTIFADFESLLVPNSNDKKYAVHKPSSIACLTVSSFPQYNSEQMC